MNLWESRALPIMRYAAEHESEQRLVNIGELASATGIDPNDVVVEVERLTESGYIAGRLQKLMTGGDPGPWFIDKPLRLTERGARALTVWPQADSLLEALESRAVTESDPTRKTALRAMVGAAKDIGINVLGEVIAAAAKKSAGLP